MPTLRGVLELWNVRDHRALLKYALVCSNELSLIFYKICFIHLDDINVFAFEDTSGGGTHILLH